MAKKFFELRSNHWHLVGLGLLAVITLGLVAYAFTPAKAPSGTAAPVMLPSATDTVAAKPLAAFV